MSTSGSNSGALRPFTARELIEEATSRAGIRPAQLSSEIIEKSLDQLNLVFTEMLNRGVQLWRRQRSILPVYMNRAIVPLDPGVNMVAKLTRRSLSRQVGVPFSNQGGDASLAFDGLLDTACAQTATNGSVGCLFASPIQITTVGVNFSEAMAGAFFYEYTQDGVTWTALDAYSGEIGAGRWLWRDLDGAPAALGWRVRSVAPTFFAPAEIYFGNTPTEIVLGPWNLDEYNAMPNKTEPGRVVNYYQQRDRDAPVLMVWPVPDQSAMYDQLVVWTYDFIQTVDLATQALDVPRRWYDAITAKLARRLCRSLPEADFGRYDMLRGEELEAVELAEGEERDPSNVNIDLGVGVYTA